MFYPLAYLYLNHCRILLNAGEYRLLESHSLAQMCCRPQKVFAPMEYLKLSRKHYLRFGRIYQKLHTLSSSSKLNALFSDLFQ